MTTSAIVSFALVMAILITHAMHACPLSTGLCKQYGHSCLGGHGKRSDDQNPKLLRLLLREMYEQPKQQLPLPTKNFPDNKDWSDPLERKINPWDGDSDDSLTANFFN